MKYNIWVFAICVYLISSMEMDEQLLEEVVDRGEIKNRYLRALRKNSILEDDSATHLENPTLLSENYIDSFFSIPNMLHTPSPGIKGDKEKTNLTESEFEFFDQLVSATIHDINNNDPQSQKINNEVPKIKFEKKNMTDKKLISNRLFELEDEEEEELIRPLLTTFQIFGYQEIGPHSMTKKINFVHQLNQMIEFELGEINPHRFPAFRGYTAEARRNEVMELWKRVKDNIHKRLINYNLENEILQTSDANLQYLVQRLVTKSIFHVGKTDLRSAKGFMKEFECNRASNSKQYRLFVFYRYHSGLKLLELAERKCSAISIRREDLCSTSLSEHDLETLSEVETLSEDYEKSGRAEILSRMMYVLSKHSLQNESPSNNSKSPTKI